MYKMLPYFLSLHLQVKWCLLLLKWDLLLNFKN